MCLLIDPNLDLSNFQKLKNQIFLNFEKSVKKLKNQKKIKNNPFRQQNFVLTYTKVQFKTPISSVNQD